MKKITAMLTAVIVTTAVTVNIFAAPLVLNYDGKNYNYTGKIYILKVNGEVVNSDVPPVVLGNNLLIPARAFFEKLGAKVTWNASTQILSVALNGTNYEFKINDKNIKIDGKTVTLNYPVKMINGRAFFDVSFISYQLGMMVGLPGTGNVITADGMGKLKKVRFSVKSGMGGVLIDVGSYKGYNVFRLTGPDRIVIDIPKTEAPSQVQKIDVNQGYIKSIRYFQWQGSTARVVLDLNGQPAFEMDERNGQLGLYVSNPGYKNFEYVNEGDRMVVKLYEGKLTEWNGDVKKFYTEKYENNGKKYTITFASNLADLGSGVMKINDGALDSIEIKKISSKQTSITFNAKDSFVYVPFYRPTVNNTAITIVKPAAKGEKLVVVDAGHGGDAEPGAIYGNLKEKDLNLDIALRLNSLLKNKNIKSYMIREKDVYVWWHERAAIANAMNAALFLSIHNNALGDPNYGGTMTLFFSSSPSGFSGKRYAQIIQSKLLSALKTTDRKIIQRTDLAVLNGTTMPAVLAEIAFMTNKTDRENLQKPEFRQKAANALCEGIIQALSEVK